ncbi:MAG: hypothetical protein M1118_00565 [Chloroflexi bacterium]|nr:hypothetical protein [Chloroflexota bacterium]
MVVTVPKAAPAAFQSFAATAPVGVDGLSVLGQEIYLYCPNGYGRTKLSNAFFERQLATTATTRNWKTVSKLLDIART